MIGKKNSSRRVPVPAIARGRKGECAQMKPVVGLTRKVKTKTSMRESPPKVRKKFSGESKNSSFLKGKDEKMGHEIKRESKPLPRHR